MKEKNRREITQLQQLLEDYLDNEIPFHLFLIYFWRKLTWIYKFNSTTKRNIGMEIVEEYINATRCSCNTLHGRKRTEMAEKNISGNLRKRAKIKIGQLSR